MTNKKLKSQPSYDVVRKRFQSSFRSRFVSNSNTDNSQVSTSASVTNNDQQRTEPPVDNRSTLPDIKSEQDACKAVESAMSDQSSDFCLIPCSEYRGSGRRTAKIYQSYHVLCRVQPRISAGWMVCNHFINGFCSLPDALKRYNANVGTTLLIRHAEKHKEEDSVNAFQKFKVTGAPKSDLINAAAMVSIMDNRPMNFCEGKKGITQFANTLLKIGQGVPSGRSIDVKDLLPCAKTIKKEINSIGKRCREELKKSIRQLGEVGGGITSDGVKCEITGKKFYDFVVHYIELPKPGVAFESWRMKTRLLIITRHDGAEDALSIRRTLSSKLKENFDLDFSFFLSRFSFTTDCAAHMPRVFDASVSSNQIPFSERRI